jgi:hypothetical protein
VDPASTEALPEEALAGLSRFEGPRTVRVSASRPPRDDELDLHFVNYNRQEPAEPRSPGGGIQDERPIAAPGMAVDLLLPAGSQAAGAAWITPEEPEPRALPFTTAGGRLHCEVPPFLVYGVLRVRLVSAAARP